MVFNIYPWGRKLLQNSVYYFFVYSDNVALRTMFKFESLVCPRVSSLFLSFFFYSLLYQTLFISRLTLTQQYIYLPQHPHPSPPTSASRHRLVHPI